MHVVGAVTLLERELGLKVELEVLDLVDLLEEDGVKLLLDGDELGGDGLGLLEELLGDGKVSLGDIDNSGGGDNVTLVNAAKGDAVNLVGASDEDQARLELLKEDSAGTSVATSKKDHNGAGNEVLLEGSLADLLVGNKGLTGTLGSRETDVHWLLSRLQSIYNFGG